MPSDLRNRHPNTLMQKDFFAQVCRTEFPDPEGIKTVLTALFDAAIESDGIPRSRGD